MQKLLGEDTTTSLLALYERVNESGNTRLEPRGNSVKLPSMERHNRGRVHQVRLLLQPIAQTLLTYIKEIRRIFESKIETETNNDGVITAVPYNPRFAKNSRARGQRPRSNQLSFKKLGGDYLHFTLYKENKDTMDAINQIARMLKIKANVFGFAGTKDRRAGTVQRVSVHRIRHESLDFLNAVIPAVKMGDYKYSQYPIQLGDHGGNEFKITLKNVTVTRGDSCSLERRVQLTTQAVETAVGEIAKYGFINYFGLQRFGTHAIGTHELGKMMLMEDFEAVTDALLHVDSDFMKEVLSGRVQELPSNRDEINRVRAIAQFKTAKDAKAALQTMPRRFGSEINVIQHLERTPRDFQGAILGITRGMRNLYLHAYQSYVWNHVASHRWAKYGSKVIPGDLVLTTPGNTTDVDGGINDSKAAEDQFQRARALSLEEANSGRYSIFDVVLPGPGFDVIYPDNDIGEFYVEFMNKPENGGLDPHKMRRSKKDFSVSGSYRHLLGRFKGEPRWEVRTYVDDSEQMRPTDVDLIEIRKAEAKAKEVAQVQQKEAKITETAQLTDEATTTATTSTERRRQQKDPQSEPRVNDVWAQTSEDGSSKRIKFKQDDSRPDTPEPAGFKSPGQGGAPLWAQDGKPQQALKPTRQPTVPNGSAGFVASEGPQVASVSIEAADVSDADPAAGADSNKSKDESALAETEDKSKTPKNDRPGNEALKSFTQPDLSSYKNDDIKIAVVLEFSLNQSAYATVVLRELMAEVEPEEPGSPLYPQTL